MPSLAKNLRGERFELMQDRDIDEQQEHDIRVPLLEPQMFAFPYEKKHPTGDFVEWQIKCLSKFATFLTDPTIFENTNICWIIVPLMHPETPEQHTYVLSEEYTQTKHFKRILMKKHRRLLKLYTYLCSLRKNP